MTREEASEELARQIGWTGLEVFAGKNRGIPLDFSTLHVVPDFFTEHVAAAALVLWIDRARLWTPFSDRIRDAFIARTGQPMRTIDFMQLTPEQIALAACQFLKLEVE